MFYLIKNDRFPVRTLVRSTLEESDIIDLVYHAVTGLYLYEQDMYKFVAAKSEPRDHGLLLLYWGLLTNTWVSDASILKMTVNRKEPESMSVDKIVV